MDSYNFREAMVSETNQVWDILRGAINRRKEDGSNQWQDGYPNSEVLQNDIEKGAGYVLTVGGKIAGYCAILVNNEPEYKRIDGKWLTDGDFVVFHRLAISEEYLGQGLAKRLFRCIEDFASAKNILSLKADTNYDNLAMINIFEKMDYQYCGVVYFRDSPRKAYEKVLPIFANFRTLLASATSACYLIANN
ncbi:MAG: GNAT superfamily N-acetyltransferase [Alteromonas macleodii]|jgi:GNAT superfamily N-acetyltransferase